MALWLPGVTCVLSGTRTRMLPSRIGSDSNALSRALRNSSFSRGAVDEDGSRLVLLRAVLNVSHVMQQDSKGSVSGVQTTCCLQTSSQMQKLGQGLSGFVE